MLCQNGCARWAGVAKLHPVDLRSVESLTAQPLTLEDERRLPRFASDLSRRQPNPVSVRHEIATDENSQTKVSFHATGASLACHSFRVCDMVEPCAHTEGSLVCRGS